LTALAQNQSSERKPSGAIQNIQKNRQQKIADFSSQLLCINYHIARIRPCFPRLSSLKGTYHFYHAIYPLTVRTRYHTQSIHNSSYAQPTDPTTGLRAWKTKGPPPHRPSSVSSANQRRLNYSTFTYPAQQTCTQLQMHGTGEL